MASWGKGVQENWKSKNDWVAKETPSYSGASSSASPWNSQLQQQRDHSSWASAALEQWTGSAAAAAPSPPSTWWNIQKAPMDAALRSTVDPWTTEDPWQVSSTWAPFDTRGVGFEYRSRTDGYPTVLHLHDAGPTVGYPAVAVSRGACPAQHTVCCCPAARV